MEDEEKEPTRIASPRALAFWEILSVTFSCLIAEWVVLSFLSLHRWLVIVPALLALGFMILSHKAYRESLHTLGFRLDNLIAALRLLFWPTLIALFMIFIVGWILAGPPTPSRLLRPRLLLLPFWALFQQYALHGFMNRRAQVIFGKGPKGVILIAVVFSILHLPNLVLSGLTFFGGLIWGTVYQRQANLYALAASHTVTSLGIVMALPLSVINGLRVGFKYFG
jgi:membrane protease YdiL (CAAX protease family)